MDGNEPDLTASKLSWRQWGAGAGRILRIPISIFRFLRINAWVLFQTYIMLNVITFACELIVGYALVHLRLYDNHFAWWVGQGLVGFVLVWFVLWRISRLRWRAVHR